MHRIRRVWAQIGAIFLLLSFASLKAMASNQQRKKQQRSSGSWPSSSSDESWFMVNAVAEEDSFLEEVLFSISAVAEEDPYSEPPAASLAAVAEEEVAEEYPYSEHFAAPAAALAIEDATPVAAVAVTPLRMQPLPLWRLPLQDAPFGAALALEDAAPAAIDAAPAAIVAAPAVAEANDGEPGAKVFDLEYFRSLRPFTAACSQHNGALKFFRSREEWVDDPFQSPSLEFHASAPTAVAVINHPKGMAWTFTGEWRQWSWHEMIAQLDDDSMKKVVTGFEGRSGGLVGCSFAIRPGSYDHKRHNMLIKTATNSEQKLPIWDFVVHREDGAGIRLHPQWKGTVVETIEELGHAEASVVVTVPPRRGLGRSDGPGTYKKYKDIGITEKMRFDSSKKP